MKSSVVRTAALCACLLLTAAALVRASQQEPTPLREPFDKLPMQFGSYTGARAEDLDAKVLEVLGVEEWVNRSYRAADSDLRVGFYLGYWASQRQGDTIHSPMNCLPGSGWQPISTSRIPLPGGPEGAELNRVIVEKGGERLMVLYWYQSHGRIIASEYWSKIHMVLDAMRTNRTDAAMMRVVVPMPRDRANAAADAEKQGVRFVRELLPLLDRHLPA